MKLGSAELFFKLRGFFLFPAMCANEPGSAELFFKLRGFFLFPVRRPAEAAVQEAT